MPKCPSCEQEIDHLICFTKSWKKHKLIIDKEGKVDYTPLDDPMLTSEDEIEFECPLCQDVIFSDEPSAIDFLGGKSEEED